MTSESKYKDLINNFPSPGGGGAHQALFTAGCYGQRAGNKVEKIIADVKANIPCGTRQVPDSEIEQGIRAGFSEAIGGIFKHSGCPSQIETDAVEHIIAEGRGATEEDIRRRSPIKIDWPDHESGWRVLDTLYDDNEYIFIGDDGWKGTKGDTIRTKAEWVRHLKKCDAPPHPKIMVNPLTGMSAPTKAGDKETLRGDLCVASHRFIVAEFDNIPIEDQLAFWFAVPHLPISALIHSGKKSIHAWVMGDCINHDEWVSEIEQTLFPGFLTPLGMDSACKNASRLSRMPGHLRAETQQQQKCLYLAPQGKAIQ